MAFYGWLRHVFDAHAVIHLGKHGNLEWLPGKSAALSAACYPEVVLREIGRASCRERVCQYV